MEMGIGAGGTGTAPTVSARDFSTIFDTYYTRILRYLDVLLRDPGLAEDLTQDTFVKAYRALQLGTSPENLKAWLYAIATNTAMSALRHRRIRAWLPLPTGESAGQQHPNRDPADRSADKDLLLRAFARLSKLDTACLLLRFHQGLSYDEIAHVLGLSVPAAKMRLCRARATFREIYLSLRSEADR